MRISRAAAARLGLISGLLGSACNSVAGLEEYSVRTDVDTSSAGICETNAQCTELATAEAATGETVASVCVKSSRKCVPLKTEDCHTVTGDPLDDNAVILGSLFSTTGQQTATNLQRQQSAMLAINQINDVGGVPGATAGSSRKLVLVSCDEAANLERASRHLVDELRVPAIVGPNTSQDTIELSTEVSVPGGTVVMTPTGVASSIASLIDDGLTWLMVPTDVQRAPLMLSQINALETQLKAERQKETLKLGVIFRDDALGIGTRTSLNALSFNGKPLSNPSNLGTNVRIAGYDFDKADQKPIIDDFVALAPDIVVLAGTAEAVPQILNPLEAAWPKGSPRPHYVLIDSVKVSDLIMSAAANDELRTRVRGTGITPAPRSAPVYESFKVDYQIAYPGSSIISGMGAAYDATYAIAMALAATKDEPATGAAVKKGLRRLTGGTTQVEIGATRVLQAFQKLGAGESITAIGTFAELAWDGDGAVLGGTIEMWCIGAPGGKPAYQSSGLTYDLMTQKETGTFTPCAP